jgi:YebC/PmpR family DNA-binding regulatory protein
LSYEGYGPGGVAILVETLTDNKNRTVAEVRHCFSKYGGSLGTNGSVAYLFDRTGIINLSAKCDDELVMEIALEAGAEDIVSNDDGSTDVLTKLETFGVIQDALVAKQLVPETAEMTMLAATEVELDLSTAQTLLKLIEHMEELDDVQNVYSNANISDEIAAQL